MEEIVLALDVSTSVTGVSVIDANVAPDDVGSHILLLDRIEFKGCSTLWAKADCVKQYLRSLAQGDRRIRFKAVRRIAIEEPLMGFRPGMSSAQTITQLMRFNGIVSYIAYTEFGVQPEYLSSAHARKLCGIKLQKTAMGGPQKEQVFAHMMAHDLKHVAWPQKKSGQVVDWSRDACDAYVIARAAAIEGAPVPTAKRPARQSKKTATK